MKQDEIILMADASGISLYGMGFDRERFVYFLERFAKMVAKAEREACLKAFEKIKNDLNNWPAAFEGVTAETKFMRSMGETIAQPFIEAIQSREQE